MKRITFAGLAGSMEVFHVGGTGSVLRRLAGELRGRGVEVDFLILGRQKAVPRSTEAEWSLRWVPSLGEFATTLEKGEGDVALVYLTPALRVAFAALRRRLQRFKRVHDMRFCMSDSLLKRRFMYLDHDLHGFNGRCFALSPRLLRSAARHAEKVGLLWPLVPDTLRTRTVTRRKGPPRIGYVGRLDRSKGSFLLPEIARQLARRGFGRLVVYGYHWPYYKPSVEALEAVAACPEISLQTVDMQSGGAGSDKALHQLLWDLDFALLPYQTGSASIDTPAFVLEAMAAGVVPITADVADLFQIIGAGGMVLPRSAGPKEYVDALVDLSAQRDSTDLAERARRRFDVLGASASHLGEWFLEALTGTSALSAPSKCSLQLAINAASPEGPHAIWADPSALAIPARGQFLVEPPARSEVLIGLAGLAVESGLGWAVLRNHDGLPDRIGNDVDILVEDGRLRSWIALTERYCREAGVRLVRCSRHQHFAGLYVACRGEEILHLDFFEGLTHRGVVYCESGQLLAERRPGAFGFVLRPGHEGALILLHDILAFGSLRQRYHGQVAAQLDADGAGWNGLLGRLLGPNLTALVGEAISDRNWDGLAALAGRLRRVLLVRVFRAQAGRSCASSFGYARHLVRRLFSPEGFLIVLAGPDGVGKSTTAAGLSKSLEHVFSGVEVRHSRPGRLPPIRKLLGLAPAEGGTGPSRQISDTDTPSVNMFRAIGNMVYYLCDHLLDRLSLMRRLGNGKAIVYDRYYYDYLVLPGYRSTPAAIKRFLCSFVRRPDCIVLLNTPAALAYSRKREVTEAEARRQLDEWTRVACRFPSILIENTGHANETVAHVVDVVLSVLAAKQRN